MRYVAGQTPHNEHERHVLAGTPKHAEPHTPVWVWSSLPLLVLLKIVKVVEVVQVGVRPTLVLSSPCFVVQGVVFRGSRVERASF